MKPNILHLSIIFGIILICACSKSVVVTEDNQEPEIVVLEDTMTIEEDMVMEEDTLFIVPDSSFLYGSVYFACDMGPYQFSIDSLIANCSAPGSLSDSLNIEAFVFQDSSLVRCTYDFIADQLSDVNNPDFTISRSLDGQTFEASWAITIDSITATNFSNETIILENGMYPFYNAYKVNISQDSLMHLYFFNSYIGGCLHDLMVWELTTN